MARDPYEDVGAEELEASGASGWFSESLAEQKKRQAELRSKLGEDTASIKNTKEKLKGLLALPPLPDSEEPAPDLFASERLAAKKKDADLGTFLGDFRDAQAAEKKSLKNLFGK